MRCKTIRVLLLVLLAVSFHCLSLAQSALRIDESAIRIRLLEPETVVVLPVDNATGQAFAARVRLELLDPRGALRATAERDVAIGRRSSSIEIPLRWAAAPPRVRDDGSELLWYRLRYRLAPAPGSRVSREPLQGLLSVSEITPDFFKLEVVAPEVIRAGERYAARVRAVHPVTGRPVPAVSIEASLKLSRTGDDEDQTLLAAPVTTDDRGLAAIAVALPQRIDDSEIELAVTGRRGVLSATAKGATTVDRDAQISLTTDKPLYQPGQTLHLRFLAFDPNRKAIAGQPLTLKILDPEDSVAFRASATTSRFGIAGADWSIPANLRLGSYRVQAEFPDGPYKDSHAATTVQISRYDLPTFVVMARPDRSYYLPDQSASVDVTAQFVYGEPVRRGHVRVARETRREWNFRRQKWEIDEARSYEGDTNDQGVFTAHLDLAPDQADLAAESYQRFRDVSFAAYFTETASGRTEQRRFNVRLTREPIHVYVTALTGGSSDRYPLDFYVSTSYADGSPASCDVDISVADSSAEDRPADRHALPATSLGRVRTNRYGVAKVTGLVIPVALQGHGDELEFHARDRKSTVGTHSESFYPYPESEPFIRVEMQGAVHWPGDVLEADISAAPSETTAIVDVEGDSGILDSRIVRLRQGRAHVTFQSNEKYQNAVTIVAYAPRQDADDPLYSSRTVWFPHDRDLKLDVTLDKPAYRPGEQVNAGFRVAGPDGFRKQAALGLVVLDRAVEERQRTEQEFASGGGSCCSLFREFDDQEIAGIRIGDLDKLDRARPVAADFDLVAEILLQREVRSRWHNFFGSDSGATDLHRVFADQMSAHVRAIRAALDQNYERTQEYPRTAADVERIASLAGVPFGQWRDPWGRPYRSLLAPSGDLDTFTLLSAGPDRVFDTPDDIQAFHTGWPYFKPYEQPIQRALDAYHARTGGLIRDAEGLKKELAAQGVAWDRLRDPWGRPYQLSFGARQSGFMLFVRTLGPNPRSDADGFTLFSTGVDYFDQPRARLDRALLAFYNDTQSFPESMDAFRRALASSAIDWDHVLDFWDHPLYVTFDIQSDYWDQPIIQSYEDYLARGRQRVRYIPVTRQTNWIHLRSAGPDGIEGNADDFELASWSCLRVEQKSNDPAPVAIQGAPPLLGAFGAIGGKVVDQTGGVIAGAAVTAADLARGAVYTAQTDENGSYLLRNLPAGFYLVSARFAGFQAFQVSRVPVSSSSVTGLDAVLVPGQQTQTITVTEALPLVNTTSATLGGSMAQTITNLPLSSRNYQSQLNLKSAAPQGPLATPRLREDFPETLFWQPELVSDRAGSAHLRFPLADNITTWKLSVIASTEDGMLGTVEKDIRAFQPFFVEHDPPRSLTVGDRIDLPVVLRNYLNQNLQLDVAMKPETWFTPLGPQQAHVEVQAGESLRQLFSFAAQSPIHDGKNRVSAAGAVAGDAIERKITVRPNGREITQSTGQVFGETAAFDLNLPQSALPGGSSAYLKIYPNLASHVLESLESILIRPYGCAEQTISSTYPNILFLRLARTAQDDSSPAVKKARLYVRLGYERLLTYREAGGGFSYWGKGSPDAALTAYAVQFLRDAGPFADVDDSVIREARAWLLTTSQADRGRRLLDGDQSEDDRRNAILTAYVARLLAGEASVAAHAGESPQSSGAAAVTQSLQYLRDKVERIDEPYLIASYVLTAVAAGDQPAVAAGMARLRSLENREGPLSYWALETNTPFYGWGQAGRIETTALVLQALCKGDQTSERSPLDDAMISRGLLFLLRNQDRYGIWHSTQATVSVLQAIVDVMAAHPDAPGAGATKVPILLDGKEVTSVDLPPDGQLSGPVTVDLSSYVTPGDHRIELKRTTPASRASAQLVVGYYVSWSQADGGVPQQPAPPAALRLSVNFDTLSAGIGDAISCAVDAERVGFQGYGMMLAEIGLPPGADVDRASLDRAMQEPGAAINHYDLLPDRVVFYLWPRAGGSKFTFNFKPRFSMNALTAPSTLYDYYNPEAQATVEPARFVVK